MSILLSLTLKPRLFFKPVELYLQLTDFLVELFD